MNITDKCRTRALILKEIAKEAPDFEAQILFVADQWMTLAAIEEIVRSRPSGRQSFH
jgi:hypothetical protein